MSGGVSQEELAAKLGEVESTLTARFEEQQAKAEGRMERLLIASRAFCPRSPRETEEEEGHTAPRWTGAPWGVRLESRREPGGVPPQGTCLRLWAPALGMTAGSAGLVPEEPAGGGGKPHEGRGTGSHHNRARRKGNSNGKGNGNESGGGGAEKRARVRCFRCGKMGRRIAECPTKESDVIRYEVCTGFGHKKDRCPMEEEEAVIAAEMSQDELDTLRAKPCN
ncbi:unnamed protein product [Ectocarpus sp. CCAP 1310/34]|nr:unnamed protein product [Ectocarpus sp. CCAP 1310/34]